MNPLFSPAGKSEAKGDAKWQTSIRRMFDSLRMPLNSFNRDMFKPFRSHRGLLGWYSIGKEN